MRPQHSRGPETTDASKWHHDQNTDAIECDYGEATERHQVRGCRKAGQRLHGLLSQRGGRRFCRPAVRLTSAIQQNAARHNCPGDKGTPVTVSVIAHGHICAWHVSDRAALIPRLCKPDYR